MKPTILLFGAASLGLLGSSPALADYVRIYSIDGVRDANHARELYVAPGEVVRLEADLFGYRSGRYYADQRHEGAENFIWQSSDQANECDAYYPDECEEYTDFQVGGAGVDYYVPFDMPQQITLTVMHYDTGGQDRLVLKRRNQYDTIEQSIDHLGYWQTIHGVRYWVPGHVNSSWVPYQNGYWSYTGYGLTWVSYDPWGWYTDHYGFWRFHASYGWVWRPFPKRIYRPYVVSFFYTDNYIGWNLYCPWANEYGAGYRRGYNDGFQDGFYEGFQAGAGAAYVAANTNMNYRRGTTVVTSINFRAKHIAKVRMVEKTQRRHIFKEAVKQRRVGRLLGGRNEAEVNRFIQKRVGVLEKTKMVKKKFGNREVVRARRKVVTPNASLEFKRKVVKQKTTQPKLQPPAVRNTPRVGRTPHRGRNIPGLQTPQAKQPRVTKPWKPTQPKSRNNVPRVTKPKVTVPRNYVPRGNMPRTTTPKTRAPRGYGTPVFTPQKPNYGSRRPNVTTPTVPAPRRPVVQPRKTLPRKAPRVVPRATPKPWVGLNKSVVKSKKVVKKTTSRRKKR